MKNDREATRDVVRRMLAVCACVAIAAPAAAQQTAAAPDTRPAEWLIASAVLAAPAAMRAGAEVRAWKGDDLVVLRKGTNDIICLADRPEGDDFSAACYHATLEPFMERGRALGREGVEGAQRNEIRWREIREGTLTMPPIAMVYNLRMPMKSFDPAAVDPATGFRLHALYMPNATTESTGIPVQPGDGPWLMFPGTPSAHVMISLPTKPAAER